MQTRIKAALKVSLGKDAGYYKDILDGINSRNVAVSISSSGGDIVVEFDAASVKAVASALESFSRRLSLAGRVRDVVQKGGKPKIPLKR